LKVQHLKVQQLDPTTYSAAMSISYLPWDHSLHPARFKRSGKKGRVDLAFHLSPRGCAGSVHPQWIPQLQLHMAATGCESVLLASR
jgi:hypothetical protein